MEFQHALECNTIPPLANNTVDDWDGKADAVTETSFSVERCSNVGFACNHVIQWLSNTGRDFSIPLFRAVLEDGCDPRKELVNLGSMKQTVI